VGVGNKELLNPVVFFGGRGRLASTPSALCLVLRERLALDVASVGQCDHHLLRGNEVFGLEVLGVVLNDRATHVTELLADGLQLLGHDCSDSRRPRKNVEQVGNLLNHIFVLSHDLVLLKARESLQAHLKNFTGLHFTESVALARESEVGRESIGTKGLGHRSFGGTRQQLLDQIRPPGPAHQALFGLDRRWR